MLYFVGDDMKLKLFTIPFLVSILISCSISRLATEEEMKHEFIHEFENLDKGQIFDKCTKWIGLNFRSAQNVIDVQNRESGILIAKGISAIDPNSVIKDYIAFTLNIDIKDYKARFRYTPEYRLFMNTKIALDNSAEDQLYAQKLFIRLDEDLSKFINTNDDF